MSAPQCGEITIQLSGNIIFFDIGLFGISNIEITRSISGVSEKQIQGSGQILCLQHDLLALSETRLPGAVHPSQRL